MLVQVFNTSNTAITIVVSRPSDANTGYGNLSVDWGDGQINTYNGNWVDLKHTYANTGQYLIKITTAAESCFLQNIYGGAQLLIARLGKNIILNNHTDYSGQKPFRDKHYLKWVDYKGSGDLPKEQAFWNCYALRKLEISKPLEIIPYQTFFNCYALNFKKIDFSQVVKIDYGAFGYCHSLDKLNLPNAAEINANAMYGCTRLEILNAPICTTFGDYACTNCYNLQNFTASENCAYGSNCFQNCYSLFPRPDGSVN